MTALAAAREERPILFPSSMPLALIVVIVVLAHTAYNGSRLTISLNALSMGATPLTVGVLMSLIAALPMLLGIASGRLVDRIGVRRPLLGAVLLLIIAVSLPGFFPGLVALHFAAAGAGTGFMLFHICVQHMVGEMSSDAERRDNFGWLALGFATSNFIGPTFAGVAIDTLGHRATFCLLALFAVCALALLLAHRERLPHAAQARGDGESRGAFDLLRSAELRRVFLVSGLLASAWDLFVFVMPIYGTSIGLNATTIGLILAAFAAATFVVRVALPWISRRMREWPLITATFCVACIAYAIFPMVRTVPMLASIAFLLGLGLGATQPSIMALVYATAPAGRAGEAVGVRTVVLNASHTVFPLMFGALGAALGMLPVFWSMAAALAAGGWFANRRRRADPGR
jgi:predicted MFS family arabinose efflux permease